MDYDDNDVSRHNLQLAGEGRSRSSSVLRPYDFPKFDFDDNLQGHLRFDSLVETEVFLGIQNQEDNQWIEDFSRGSNGMEFNSTPADSCSISRQNNVWSEATSSESVEMLLKSVGQEDMVPGETITRESNACNDQGTLTQHVEPGNNMDEKNGGSVANSDVTLPQDEFHKGSPDSKENVEKQFPEVEGSLLTHEIVESACGTSDNLKGERSTNDRKHSDHDKSADEILKESKTSVEKSLSCGTGDDGVHCTKVVDNIDSKVEIHGSSETLQQVTTNISHGSRIDGGEQVHDPSVAGQENSKILEENTGEAGINFHTVGSSHSLGSGMLNSKDDVESSVDCIRESASKSMKGESELKSSEGDDRSATSRNLTQISHHAVKVLHVSSKMADPFDDCRDGSVVDHIEQHAEIGSLDAENANTEQKMDSALKLTYRRDKMEDGSAAPFISDSISETPLFSVEGNKFPIERFDRSDAAMIGKSSDVSVLSSSGKSNRLENTGDYHIDSVVAIEESGAFLPTPVMDASGPVIEESLAHRQVDFSEPEQDICKTIEEDKKLPADPVNMDSENVGTLTTQFVDIGKGAKGNDIIPKIQPQTSSRMESGIAQTIQPQTSSRKESDNVSSHAKSSNSATLGDHTENGEREPVLFGLSHPENDRKDFATRVSSDANVRSEVDGVSKVEVSVVDAAVRTRFSGMAAESPKQEEKSNDARSSQCPSLTANNSLHSDCSQVHSDRDRSSLKESVDFDFDSGGNHEVRMIKAEGEESAHAADVDKASCGSPTIISSSEPSQAEKDNQDEAKGSEVVDKLSKDILSTLEDPRGKDAVVDDTSFTFKVNALPDSTEGEPGRSWSPFPNVGKCKTSVVIEETTPSGKGKVQRMPSQKTPRQSARVSDGEPVHGTSKGTSERKGRRGSAKGTPKETAKKGSQVKGTNQEAASAKGSASAKGNKMSNIFLSSSSGSPHVHLSQIQPRGHIEKSSNNISSAIAVPTSSLPDLNSSALNSSTSPSATFQQPFTDLQQVQLRAQIFVYGYLIQGTAPDEACMVSAFGISDGRSIWEPVWRAAVERIRCQKSNSNLETPLHSRSDAKGSDTAVKHGSHSSKVLSSPVGRACNKGTSAANVNPIIPLSSPLWSISTPTRDSLPSSGMHKGPVVDYQHAVTPLRAYQTPPVRNLVGHTSWPSQTCFPGPWLSSPQTSTFNSSVRFQPVTMTETVKLTPVKDTSGPVTSGMKQTSSSPAVYTLGPSPVCVGVSPLLDPKRTASTEQHSMDSKPRKKRKAAAPDPGQVSLLPEAQSEPLLPSAATNVFSSVAIPAISCPASEAVVSKASADASAICSVDCSRKGDLETGKAVTCSEDTLGMVAEAKSEAENAASLAAAAVSHSEDLWSRLVKEKESGLTSEAESKLASAAAAIAAAASVAKAAAAAAKIACNAALQAKLMAEEVFLSYKTSGALSSGITSTEVHGIGNVTPSSILKGDKVTNQSSSILLAAKEAAKRRIEAASAASKQAENLDAIVKAAELAAEAVAQAGKIVAMGDPLPLRDLIEAGQEGYWKSTRPSFELAEKPWNRNKEQAGGISLEEVADIRAKVSGEDSIEKERSRTVGRKKMPPAEISKDSLDGHARSVDGVMGSTPTDEEDFRNGKGTKASDTEKSSGMVSEPDATRKTVNVQSDHDESSTIPEDGIKEGSVIEVFKHGEGLKSAWYSANVLALEDGKAYVCYSDLLSEEGSGNLQEWVSLESEGDKAPIIRPAHPLTALQFQATRKRRRGALGDYTWCVGDRVDVWIDDCWWEGVVTEKNEKDETTLKVHFPAQGETSTVRAWNLRTSRSWNDGKWVEWSSLKGPNASEQSDRPQEKRQKLGSPLVATKGKDKSSNDMDSASGKPEESKLLALSTSDRMFNIGKTIKEDNKRAVRRPLKTGQQKERSRVIFGVPKPTGKKRKFMEVSKHFPTTRSDKNNEANDSVKFAKYLMPQATASRAWRVPSRNDSKDKRTAESRSRIPFSRKPHRTLPQRENLKSTSVQDNDSVTDHGTDIEDFAGHDENTSRKLIQRGLSSCEEAAEAPLSSLLANSLGASLKKMSSSSTKTEGRKLAPSGGKLSKIEEDKVHSGNLGKSLPEATEPRRSNRRIQPTHRLLEGLQSSMIISKMPSVSYDKGQKNQSRNFSTRGK